MLVVIEPTGSATVYLNEVDTIMTARIARRVDKGRQVTKDDIAEIAKIEFSDITIPHSAGFLYIFSVGWRKGLFYDYGPLVSKEKQPRRYDLPIALGRVYCHVLYQEIFSISNETWDLLFSAKWFPFIGLSDRLTKKLIEHVSAKGDPDELLDEIVSEMKAHVGEMLESWRKHASFVPHLKIVETAVERFLADDHVSCTSTLYPRIEGILRTYHRSIGRSGRISSKGLAATAVANKRDNYQSLVLPQRFESYLSRVYFAEFDPNDPDVGVSRHSVAHGEANASNFDLKSSVISLLIVHQLFYTLESEDSDTEPS